MTPVGYMAWGSTVLTIPLGDGDIPIFRRYISPFHNLNCINGVLDWEAPGGQMVVNHGTKLGRDRKWRGMDW